MQLPVLKGELEEVALMLCRALILVVYIEMECGREFL